MEEVNKNPVFAISDLDLKFNKPEIRIEIDRERARQLGVTVRDIAETLRLFYSGTRYGTFLLSKDSKKQYEVIGETARTFT
ncbi:MAG: efflux RND transporter permease subunit [Haliscomenobacter sp.]|nr:efflux RND transporter permease subunit [Haliscomenobacter sp.]